MSGEPVRIELGGRNGTGLRALVDAADAELVGQYRWWVRPDPRRPSLMYACSKVPLGDGRRTTIYMHRLITGAPDSMVVDHIDHDGLNNRRSNLRVVEQVENIRWQRPSPGKRSQYKGVFAAGTRWCARIQHHGKREHLGLHTTEQEAARAYDCRARQLFGTFAWLNFPDEVLDAGRDVA